MKDGTTRAVFMADYELTVQEGKKMPAKRVLPTEWSHLFERFTREHLRDSRPETVTIEVVSPEAGDLVAVKDAKLLGVTYDRKSSALEIALDGSDHLIFQPIDIWVMTNEMDGFIDTIDLVRADGTKEILYLHRSGVAV
jgi:hypothetical protein